jgi:hypothetical protein
MKNPHEHNANCLLGISDDLGYKDVKDHLEWLIENPSEIADGYEKDYITFQDKEETLKWVSYFLLLKK